MSLVLLGINHKTAPLELRERVAIQQNQLVEATRALAATPGVLESMILSTCNRVELVATVNSPDIDLAIFLNEFFLLEPRLLAPHLYEYREQDAVRHLFRVAASLDSMVLGEPQILGQVKDAYAAAREAGTISSQLDRLLQSTFATAKRVRSETRIGTASVSIASVAVDLAKDIFGSLEGKKVLLVGAGKMSELAASHLMEQGAGTILVANRTTERALGMARQFDARVMPYDDLYDYGDQADIIITSTGSPTPIFRKEHGQAFLHRRKNRPMFFIDIAVPRDVDPEMNKLEGVFVYDVDDLQAVAAAHLDGRAKEAQQAEALVALEVERYRERLQALDAAPAIVQLQESAEEIRQSELQRAEVRLQSLTREQRMAVESLTRGLLNKFLHHPMQALKAAARDRDEARFGTICDIFDLNSHTLPVTTETSRVAGDVAKPAPIDSAAAELAAPDRVRKG